MSDREVGKSWDNIAEAGRRYGEQLHQFVSDQGLPEKWFEFPDHLAIKCYDIAHYQEIVEAAKTYAARITQLPLNGRLLGTVELVEPIDLTHFGAVSWIEIMEPRPEKVGRDVVGIDHAEFCFADFAQIEATLAKKAIASTRESNPSHEWVSIQVGQTGPELKLNNGTLADIVEHELAQGLSEVIWEKKSNTMSKRQDGAGFMLQKLIRDKVLDDMLTKGQHPQYKRLEDHEFLEQLTKKIKEESDEFDADASGALDELSDLIEVIETIAELKGVNREKLHQIQDARREKKGGFTGRIYVERLDLDAGDSWIDYYRGEPGRFPEV